MTKRNLLIIYTSSILVISLVVGGIVFFSRKSNGSGSVANEYTVSFDTKGGTEIPSIKVKEGKKIDRPADPIKNGYHINEWTQGGKTWIFDTHKVYSDITLVASWGYNTYTITYDFNGGTTSENYKTSYNIASSFDLIRPKKDGTIFGGWFDQSGHRVDGIIKGMTGDLLLTAKWIDNLVVTSLDEARGTINVYSDEHDINKIVVKNVPVDSKYHVFNGWYDENKKLLSTEQTYTFVLKENVINYINASYMSDSQEDEWNLKHGVTPSLDYKNNTITYGMYPQNNVSDKSLTDVLNKQSATEINGYYYYNHEYYLKKKASLARDFATRELLSIHNFDNGVEITEDNDYWFKVEPISWRILEHENNNYYLLCEKLVDVKKYDKGSAKKIDDKEIMPNNYKYSDIRTWLNADFYNNAFYFDKANIQTMEVDNSASSTATPDSGFECENTNDNVTLLSYKDYTNPEYGFSGPGSSPSARKFLTTDYARASKANYSTDEAYPYSGYCWTRSPIKTSENNGYCVSRNNKIGVLNNDYVGFSESCVQPAITIVFDI